MILGPEPFEFLVGDERFFFGLVTCDARSVFVLVEVGEGALRRLAAVHEEGLVAFERRDARLERRDFRAEVVDRGAARVAPVSEKDASQRGRDERVVLPRDDGHVGPH